jgi:YesN/AraC family two-component response regulator
MIHKLDKETIKRIVDLHQEQGLSFPILGERFGVSTTRISQIFKCHREKQQDSNVKPEHLHVRIQKRSHAANFKHHEFVKT